MSPFGNLMGGLQGLLSGQPGAASALFSEALADMGGYQGVLNKLEQSGLGAQVDSWLSTHASNLPVTPDEIQAALGDQRLQELGQRFGVPVDQVAQLISRHLPTAVDEASPAGVIQDPPPTPPAV